MSENFQTDSLGNYDVRNRVQFKFGKPKRVHCGTERISVLGAKLWVILPDEYKDLNSVRGF